MSAPRFSLLFIIGESHSGSTLLGRLLSLPPQALYVGESLRLDEALRDPEARCSCEMLINDCPTWQRRLRYYPDSAKTDYRNITLHILDELRTSEGVQMLIDSSKDRGYRLSRWCLRPEVGYVLMVRDPRGVLRYSLRTGWDLHDLLRRHRKWIRRYAAFARRHPQSCLTVFYEDLIASPETEVGRICDFVGMEFAPAMLAPNTKGLHQIRTSISPYLKGTNQFAQDDRWRQELSRDQIAAINDCLQDVDLYRRYRLAETAGAS